MPTHDSTHATVSEVEACLKGLGGRGKALWEGGRLRAHGRARAGVQGYKEVAARRTCTGKRPPPPHASGSISIPAGPSGAKTPSICRVRTLKRNKREVSASFDSSDD